MKTLADLKRRLVRGLSVTVEFPGSIIRGNLGDTVFPARTVVRKVHSITANKVTWESEGKPGTPGSSLYWPSADCLTFLDADSVAVSHEAGGKPFATYRFAS